MAFQNIVAIFKINSIDFRFFRFYMCETKTLIRKLKRILVKLYRQNVSLLFNQTYLNEKLLPN